MKKRLMFFLGGFGAIFLWLAWLCSFRQIQIRLKGLVNININTPEAPRIEQAKSVKRKAKSDK